VTVTIEAPVGIGAEHGVPAAQVALAHTPRKPAGTSLIAGAQRPR
jgi:aryl-alcohol dehydrogenase-like predicted oxidoreductase